MTPEDRFWSKTARGTDDECWPWQGTLGSLGYARFSVTGFDTYAHRFSYELTNGPIPKGLVIDHLCRVRHCMNSKHMEAVTIRENVARGEGHTVLNAQKTHCKHGHEFTPDNTLTRNGWRECRTCKRIRKRKPARLLSGRAE